MVLPDVVKGDPHVAAHNDERHLINQIQYLSDPEFRAGLLSEIESGADLMAAARPRDWVRVYRVNKAGGAGVFTSINAAVTQAKTDNASTQRYGYPTNVADSGPELRRLILIDPGEYNESINKSGAPGDAVSVSCPPFLDFVGSSGNRDDVVIWQTGNYETVNVAKSIYMAHLTLDCRGHATSTGVHALQSPGLRHSTGIFENVAFLSSNTATNGPNPVNVLTDENGLWLFYKCHMETAAGLNYQAFQGGSVPANRKRPGSTVFIECTAKAPDSTGSVVNFLDAGGGQQDMEVWVGGEIEKTATNAYTIHNGYQSAVTTPTKRSVIDPAIPNVLQPADKFGSPGTTDPNMVVRARPPIIWPSNGMTDKTRDFYLPRIDTPGAVFFSANPTGQSVLTANRMYLVPIEIPASMAVKFIRLPFLVGGGSSAVGLYKDRDDGTGITYVGRSGYASTAAAGTYNGNLSAAYTLHRGLGRVWIAVICDSATAEVAVSNILSTMKTCYYKDFAAGTQAPASGSDLLFANWTTITAGQNCPTPALVVE